MRLFSGALVFIFILFLNEIEASGFRKILPRLWPFKEEEDRRNIYFTPRLTTPSSLTHNQISAEFQALNLHGHSSQDLPEPPRRRRRIDPKKQGKKGSKEKVKDLNLEPYYNLSPEMKEVYKSRHAPFVISEDGEKEPPPFQDNQRLTESKLNRDKESFKHFQRFHHQYPPPSPPRPVDYSDYFEDHKYAASFFPPYPLGNYGDSGPSGYAAFPFLPHYEGQSGSSGTHEWVGPHFPTHQWSKDGGPGYGYGK